MVGVRKFFLFCLGCSGRGRGRSSAWRDGGWAGASYGFALGLGKKEGGGRRE